MDRTRNSDDAVIAEAFDDPAFITLLAELSKTKEWAMRCVRWALLYHSWALAPAYGAGCA